MTIRMQCPGCQTRLGVRDDLQGKQVRCPKCARTALVAGRRREYRDDDDGDDRPRRRKRKNQSAMPWILAGFGGGALLGVVLIIARAMSGNPESKPQEVVHGNPPPQRNTLVRQPRQTPLAVQPPKDRQPAEGATQQVGIPSGPTPGGIDRATTSKVKKATAFVRVQFASGKEAQGSGFFAAEKGLFFTNAHVLGMLNPSAPPPSRVDVLVSSGEPGEFTRQAFVLGVDRESDLGVLRIEGGGAGLPDPLALDSTRSLTELQEVYVFGFPFGESLGKNITINRSAISSLRRGPDATLHQIQLNGGMNPGNSGGPVVDNRGTVIGVAVAGIRHTQIVFAVPGERVQSLLWGRAVDLSIAEAYVQDAGIKLPVAVSCLDPLNRLKDVKIEVWKGNPGTVRAPSAQKPMAIEGDGPRQATALVYQNNTASADIDLPSLSNDQTFWLQPVLTDKSGRTFWSTAVAFKAGEHLAVEREPALLQLQVDSQPERTIKLSSSNKMLTYEGKTKSSIALQIDAEALEIAQKDPKGILNRLTLGDTRFAVEQEGSGLGKVMAPESKVTLLFRGRFLHFLTSATGDLVTRFHPHLTGAADAETRREFDAKLNQIANAYEMTSITLPNREVRPKETWLTKVPVLLGEGMRKEVFDMHLVCTMEGCRQVEGQNQAVISVKGRLKGRKPGQDEFSGKVTGKAYFAVGKGYFAEAKINVDCEVDFGGDVLASNIMDVRLTRTPGNTAGIVPSKDSARPTEIARGKTIFQIPMATLGPGDPTNYPARLTIPYKVCQVPFMAGKTYIIEMNRAGNDPIDPYLILHNPMNVKVAEDDDGGGNLNARIVYQAPASGYYIVYATTLLVNQGGNFQLVVSEAAAGSNKTDPKKSDTKETDPKKTDPKKSNGRLAPPGTASTASARPAFSALPSVRPEQTPGYTPMLVHGFTVIVSHETLRHNKDSALECKPLDLLEADLKAISKIMPPPALNVLRRVLIWVEWNEKVEATNGRSGKAVAFYSGGHQMQLWKEGRHPLQARSIIINDMKAFTERRQTDKSLRHYVLLHEMSHAVHDQLLGAENPNVKAVYKQALERKLLDPSAYAATNVQEFFAEMTCAYFDQLPYHPRTRADLKKHDPVAFKLMEATWGKSRAENGEPAEPAAHVQAPPLDELPLGRHAMGPEVSAVILRGRPSLVIYWNALESSSLLCLSKVAAWDAELRDFGLVTVAVHLDGKNAVDATAKARARQVAFTVNLDKWTADSLVTDFKAFPLALVYGHDGTCVFRGNPFDAEAAVRQAVGAALVADLAPDALPQPLVPVVEALSKGKPPKTQFARLTALTRSKTDADAAQLAEKLLAKLTETAAATLDRAETIMQPDPVEAFVLAESLAAAFKGTLVAARAGSILARVKQTKEVGLELKARGVLATVKKLEAYLDSVPGSFDPARPKYREDNAQTLHQLEAAVSHMKRTWPRERATQQAVRVAEKFGLTVP
jgi:S1-C subfamily serine protease